MSVSEVAEWKALIADLARSCPNIFAKIGGAQMAVNGHGFHERETPIGSEELCQIMLPWYAPVIEAFGPSRCMFEVRA